MELLTVQLGHPRYPEIIGALREPGLAGEMWSDAEHRLEEEPGKVWTFALVDDRPAAWCAARPVDGELVCSDNYERRGAGRDLGLYRAVYRQRHLTIVAPSRLPAVTYLFPGNVVELHEADGWVRTGATGPGEVAGHTWVGLRRAFERR